jgi:hypothetical protein
MSVSQIIGSEDIASESIVDGNISTTAAIAQDKLAKGAIILLADGSVLMAANFNAASYQINNLANGVVSSDAVNLGQVEGLIGGITAGLNWSGSWSSGTTYAVGDLVTFDAGLYVSILGSNVGNNPSTASTYWTLLCQGVGALVSPQTDTFNNSGSFLSAYSFALTYVPTSNTMFQVFLDNARLAPSCYSTATSGGVTTLTIGTAGAFTGNDGGSYTIGEFHGLVVDYYH